MTITFSIETTDEDIDHYAIECGCGDVATFATYPEAAAMLPAVRDRHAASCEAATYGFFIMPRGEHPGRPEMNVSNANALAIFERLGLPTDENCWVGAIDAADLLGRAMVGNVGRDDSGTSSTVVKNSGWGIAMHVDCGRRAGYFEHRLGTLAEIARYAMDMGRRVVWS